jgi:iron complex outermembrane receptor protein
MESVSGTLQYVRGFREPTLSDRYFRGVSGRGFVVGNPDLRPERSDQFDLALRAAFSERARIALYGYLYRIHDVIELLREGAAPPAPGRSVGLSLQARW